MSRFTMSLLRSGSIVLAALLCLASSSLVQGEDEPATFSEAEAIAFLQQYDRDYSLLLNEATIASWNYDTNITDENAQVVQEVALKVSQYQAEALSNATSFNTTDFSEDTKRQLKKVGSIPLPEDEEQELSRIIADMGEIYGSTKVCLPPGTTENCHNLEPGLVNIMAESTDYDELTLVWSEWRRLVGQQIKPLYERYVELKNKRAVLNGHEDTGDEWRSRYETDSFEQDVYALYAQVEPLYKDLHAYVRRKLYDVYGAEHIDLRGPLPASVLGDMWGRFWNNLYRHMVPYPDKPSIDPTPELEAQNYTVEKMFATGDDFYASMGLIRVPDTFYNLSMLRKPEDGREVVCHATAWDFYDKKDYRIRMCTRDYNFEDLNTIHHELGHVQYFQQYKDQPVVYRDGANDGFHEAVGELMAMSASTPRHLYDIGLIPELVEDEQADINFLLRESLMTISTLPFHLVHDVWRWRVFRGVVADGDWNDDFWSLEESLVGVKAPVDRTALDLDPPTLFHVCQDYDMIRYFVRTILQFQFAERLCALSGHSGPLHRCDFSGSTEAGQALADMLRLGSSLPWQDALEALTGTRQMSAEPLLAFFAPLHDWLKEVNAANGDVPGWQ